MNSTEFTTHSLDHQLIGAEQEMNLAELLANLWSGRRLILGTTLLALLVGSYYAWRAAPVYRMDALLQIEDKKAGKGGAV